MVKPYAVVVIPKVGVAHATTCNLYDNFSRSRRKRIKLDL
jgi:hypothetical protein